MLLCFDKQQNIPKSGNGYIKTLNETFTFIFKDQFWLAGKPEGVYIQVLQGQNCSDGSHQCFVEQGLDEGAMFHIFNQFLLHFYTLSRHSSVIGIHNVLAQFLFENTEKG